MTTTHAPMGSTVTPAAALATDSRLEIEGTRPRETAPPETPFRSVLSGGVSLLLSGAEVATHVVGGPVMAAAVHDARVGAANAISGPGGGFASGGAGGSPLLASDVGGTLGTGLAGAAAQAAGTPAGMQAMMQESEASNSQLLALQMQVQDESQRFTTVSNVMRARFDTAKAAVSNIRA